MMKIRYGKFEDAETLAKVGAETFWDAYHTDSHLEKQFIRNHIDKTFTREMIEKDFSDENIIYLIAENDTEVIGYARLLKGNSRKEISGESPFEISRIYLRKIFWGKGLGSKLLERCLDEAKENFCDVVWLSVWEYNHSAIKFYEWFGFHNVGSHIFDLAGSKQTDFLMQKNL